MTLGTITRRLNRLMSSLNSELESYAYTRRAFDEKLQKLELALETPCLRSCAPSIRAELIRMFEALEIECARDKPPEYYRALLDRSALPEAGAFEEQMFRFMYRNFEQYPTPEDYMRRLVDRLSVEGRGEPLRLRILKRFVRHGNYLKDAGFGGHLEIKKYVKEKIGRAPTLDDVCKNLDDAIFDRLKEASKPQKKPEGKFGLLKLADDLAGGKFRSGGATKRGLYLFAMVYGMTYSEAGADPGTDVEKNLFWDYYSDNLMRFITAAYREGTTDFETAPSGRGINRKNFAEMIYLYFITKDMAGVDKIKSSARMIEEVQREYVGGSVEPSRDTNFYRLNDDVFAQPPERFKRFILDNYDCSTRVEDERTGKSYNVGVLQAQSEQNSARAALIELRQRLSKLIDLEACNYGLWFADVKGLDDRSGDDKLEDFKTILRGIDKILKDERIFAPSSVNRTALVAVFYYYHNESHNGDDGRRWQNFAEHLESFRDGADGWLARAGYQPLNVKNIFDMAAAFSSYAYLNY